MGAQGKEAWHDRVEEEELRQRRKKPSRPARKGQERAIQRNDPLRLCRTAQDHFDGDHGAGRMTDDEGRALAELAQQRAMEIGHGLQVRPAARRFGEADARTVGHDDLVGFGEKRCEIAKGMGGGPGAVDEENARAFPHYLHMPVDPARRHDAALGDMGPVGGRETRPHRVAAFDASWAIASASPAASAWGRAR